MKNEKIVRTTVCSGQRPTKAQIREIENASTMPETPDEDAPELTSEQYAEMVTASKVARKRS
ncbi:MAG: hypothetical protein IKS11_08150 [Lachnospiraceae bacterium]|nr:hypothetical protein [Lachnospiraceae bacterium]